MPKLTCLVGVLLIITGLAGYFLTGQVSLTALIPAAPGVLLLLFGLLAYKEGLRKHMMHFGVMISLLGALAGFGKGLSSLKGAKLMGSATFSLIMGLLCLIHLVAGIRSFRAARASRAN